MMLSFVKQPTINEDASVDYENLRPSEAEQYEYFVTNFGKVEADKNFGVSSSSFDQAYSTAVIATVRANRAADEAIDAAKQQTKAIENEIRVVKAITAHFNNMGAH